MRRRVTVVFAGAIITSLALAVAIGPRSAGQDTPKPVLRPKWEYKLVEQKLDEKQLNALGDEGWELVSATGGQPYIASAQHVPQGGGQTKANNTIEYAKPVYHFKRLK